MLGFRRRGQTGPVIDWRLVAATSLAGVRGAITLAGVLTLPITLVDGSPFPARELAIFLASAVILFSLVLASIALPRVLHGLEAPEVSTLIQQEDLARAEAMTAAIEAVERAQHAMLPDDDQDAEIYTNAAARVIDAYRRRLRDSGSGGTEEGSSGVDAVLLQRADAAEKALRLAGLQAERETIFRLARANRVGDDVSRRLVREIDLMETRYQS